MHTPAHSLTHRPLRLPQFIQHPLSSQPLSALCCCSNGIVESWGDMKSVWDHAFFDVLRVDPAAGCRIMLTEPPMNPRQNRRRMLEAMFEGYGFQAAFVQVGGAVLAGMHHSWQAKCVCVWGGGGWVGACVGGGRRRLRGSGRLSLISVCATREG